MGADLWIEKRGRSDLIRDRVNKHCDTVIGGFYIAEVNSLLMCSKGIVLLSTGLSRVELKRSKLYWTVFRR